MISAKLCTLAVILTVASSSVIKDDPTCNDPLQIAIDILKVVDANFGWHIPFNGDELDSDCKNFKTAETDILNIITPCVPPSMQSVLSTVVPLLIDPFVKDLCDPSNELHDLYLESAVCLSSNWTHSLPCSLQLAKEALSIVPNIHGFSDICQLMCPMEQAGYCTDKQVNTDCGQDAVKFINMAAMQLGGSLLQELCGTPDCDGWLTDAPPLDVTESPEQETFIQEMHRRKEGDLFWLTSIWKDDPQCQDILNATIQVLQVVHDNLGSHIPTDDKSLDKVCKEFSPTEKEILDIVGPCIPSSLDPVKDMVVGIVNDFVKSLCDPSQDFHKLYLESISCLLAKGADSLPCDIQFAQDVAIILPQIHSVTDAVKLCCPVEQVTYCLNSTTTQDCGSDAAEFVNEAIGKLAGTLTSICPWIGPDCSGWLTPSPTPAVFTTEPSFRKKFN